MYPMTIVGLLCVPALATALFAQTLPNQPTQILALTGGDASVAGLPSGTTFVDLSTPTINATGQVAFSAITRQPSDLPGKSQLGFGIFRFEGENTLKTLVHFSFATDPPPRSPTLHDGLECLINKHGDIAAVGLAMGVSAFKEPVAGHSAGQAHQALFAAAPDGSLKLLARVGDPAPGADADQRFSWFDNLMLFDNGRIAFRAGIAPVGKTLRSQFDSTLSFWTADHANPPQLLLKTGDDAPGVAPRRLMGLFHLEARAGENLIVSGDLKNPEVANDLTAPRESAAWVWRADTGFSLLYKTSDSPPGLPAGFTPRTILVSAINEAGDTLIYGACRKGSDFAKDPHEVVWVRTANGQWRVVTQSGNELELAAAKGRVVQASPWGWTPDGVPVLCVRLDNRPLFEILPWCFPPNGAPSPLFKSIAPPTATSKDIPFRFIGDLALNSRGDMAFKPTFGREGPDGKPNGPRFSANYLIAREGEQRYVVTDGSKMKILNTAVTVERSEWNSRAGLSEDGQVTLKLFFDNGSSAIVRTTPLK